MGVLANVSFMSESFEQLTATFPSFQGSLGSIVRLKINDFMTYHDVEMFAGPNVNLIMGPNGTGKSTIVCAICLSLAGKQNILGRAHALKEYIRHGCTTASVEVELFNPSRDKNKKNWTVKRVISETSTGASSDWYLNGSRSSQAQIENLMEKLNIQLDNLCQFLPQDRVQDFAKQDPIQLLKSTEKAIGRTDGIDLLEHHEELITLQKTIATLTSQHKRSEENLRIEVQHNTRVEQEVKQFEERETLKQKIHTKEGIKLWLLYQRALDEFTKMQYEVQRATQEKVKEEKKIAPLKKSIELLNGKLSSKQNELNKIRASTYSFLGGLKRTYRDKVEQAEQDITEKKAELETSERNERERLKRLEVIKERIRGYEQEWEDFGHSETRTDAEMKQEIQVLVDEQTAINSKMYELKGTNDADAMDIRALNARYSAAENSLKVIDSIRNSRLSYLQRRYPDVARAVEFFDKPENRQAFRGPIHEPLILHMNVNDQKYGKVVEKHIPNDDLTAFLVEDKDDVKTMIGITKANNMRVSCIHHDKVHNFSKPNPVHSKEMMAKYDFQKCLIELIEAPEYHMSYVVRSRSPQEILIGTARTDQVAQKITDDTSLRTFYTDAYCYTVRTSYYTKQKNSTISHLNDATIFTDKINAFEKDTLTEQMSELKAEIKRLADKMSSRQPEIMRLAQQKDNLDEQKKVIHEAMKRRVELQRKLQHQMELKQSAEGQGQQLKEVRENVKARTYNIRAKQLKHCDDCIDKIFDVSTHWVEMLFLKKQTAYLSRVVTVKQQKYEEAKGNADAYAERVRTLENQAKVLADTAKRNKHDAVAKTNRETIPPEVSKQMREEELDAEINSLHAQLNFLPDTDVRIVQDYENRKRKIAEMEKTKQDYEYELNSSKRKLIETKDVWLPPLQDLLTRINLNFGEFFASMQCVGEISLDKGEDENDFSKYGVKIMVKFRSDQPLVELTGYRQSGGERAITTALYILALQELTKVPFRVIDEINQGMDAMNETRFFNLLCSLAQGDDTPQYFLLTPKMLPPVEYPDNVDFHIIFNGPYVKVGLRDTVNIKKAQHSRGRHVLKAAEDNDAESDDMDVD